MKSLSTISAVLVAGCLVLCGSVQVHADGNSTTNAGADLGSASSYLGVLGMYTGPLAKLFGGSGACPSPSGIGKVTQALGNFNNALSNAVFYIKSGDANNTSDLQIALSLDNTAILDVQGYQNLYSKCPALPGVQAYVVPRSGSF